MSTQRTIATGERPNLVCEVGGDLVILGWERSEVAVSGAAGDELSITEEDGLVRIGCASGCSVQAPMAAAVRASAGGDARVGNVRGAVELTGVGGDLHLRTVGPVTVQQVGGDLSVRHVSGPVVVQATGGDLALGDVTGDVALSRVAGDLTLSEVGGSIQAVVGGNASLTFPSAIGRSVEVRAGGDIACRLPAGAGVTGEVQAGGRIAAANLPGVQPAARKLSFTLGDGASALHLTAGGDIALAGQPADGEQAAAGVWAEFGPEFGQTIGLRVGELAQQIAGQVEEQVEVITRQLDEKLAQLGSSEEIAARVQQKVQAAMRHAEEKIAEAIQQAERRMQQAERRAERHAARERRHAGSWPGFTPQPPQPPTPPVKPKRSGVDDEERMMVLRMVEQGTISVEQAEQLLAAMSK